MNDAKQLILETELDNVIEESAIEKLLQKTSVIKRMIKNAPIKIIKMMARNNHGGSNAPVFAWSATFLFIYNATLDARNSANLKIDTANLEQLLKTMKEWSPGESYQWGNDIEGYETISSKADWDTRIEALQREIAREHSAVQSNMLGMLISVAVLIISAAVMFYNSRKNK